MTTIDQFSSVLAPLATGFILRFGGYRLACLVIVGWNMLSWVAERHLLTTLYAQVDDLRRRSRDDGVEAEVDSLSGKVVEEEIEVLLEENTQRVGGRAMALLKRMRRSLSAYHRQAVYPAAFGLALLYMTVLGFDGLAISYGKSLGVADDVLGVFRSAGSVMGILGACSYTLVERRMGVRKTGFVGLAIQHLALWLCVVSVWLPGSPFDLSGYLSEWSFEVGLWSLLQLYKAYPTRLRDGSTTQ
jgi:solute carrier family 40 (iron-regulated transporter), member 1